MSDPIITKFEVHQYEFTQRDLGYDYNGFNLVYEPGNTITRGGYVLRVFTDQGIVGEYAGGSSLDYAALAKLAPYFIGKSALERERLFSDVNRVQRQVARIGLSTVDIALWDIAGKLFGVPVYKLLGGYKTSIPCYASTYHGDHQPDGMSTPEAYADFAEQCLDLGYPAFKIHGWGARPSAKRWKPSTPWASVWAAKWISCSTPPVNMLPLATPSRWAGPVMKTAFSGTRTPIAMAARRSLPTANCAS